MLRIAWRFSLISYFVWQLCNGFRRSVVRISFFRKKRIFTMTLLGSRMPGKLGQDRWMVREGGMGKQFWYVNM